MRKLFSLLAAVLFAGSMMAQVTILPGDFTAAETSDYSTTKGGVTVVVTASTVNADQMRIFKNQTITISAEKNITSIEFTCTANGSAKYGPGNFAAQDGYTFETSGNKGTWTGSATSVTFTAANNQVRATQIVVTLEGEGGGPVVEPEGPKNLGAKTIAEFLALKNTKDTCILTGVVSNIQNAIYGNFDLTDESGKVYVYGLLTPAGESKKFAELNVAENDTLTVLAIYNEYSGTPQAKNAIFVEVKKAPAAPQPQECDWDNIAFLGDGSPEQTFGDQFKICKVGEQPSVVNIQKPGFAAETGIYVTFPSDVFGEISLAEGKYAIQGAGMVLYLSAFTQEYTEVTVNCNGNDIVFTVYNAKGGSATAIDNTVVGEKAIKMFENGQLIIIKNGVKYNALGSVIE